jgi:transposase
VHDLPLAQRQCPGCGQEQVPIGEDISEQLDYQPSSLFVVQHVRPKYACPHCRQGVAAEAKPGQPIDRGLPGPGLLAQVVVSKYADHLPLYRLERIFARQGVNLARSTMCGWMAECASLLRPVYQLMVERVLASRVVHTDDTTMPVQDPDRDRTKTGRLWVYLGDLEHPYHVFDYTPTHERTGPGQFLKNFQGYLQADAFSGYDGIYLTQPVVEVACNAHARRKFYEARTSDEALSHQALAYYRQLYDVERQAKAREEQEKRSLSDDERKAWRQEKAVPILAVLESWLEAQKPKVLPKSPIGQAISYALNHWRALKRYTEAGFLAIDNNVAEREMKRIAIGRKNWLFAGSDEGGRTAAVLFSFTSTCYRHSLDPFVYLRDLLRRLPAHGASLEEFLPDRWQITQTAPATTDSS